MRAGWAIGLLGLGLCAMAGGAACGPRTAQSTGFGSSVHALPLGAYPASPLMTQKYGIVEWRFFAGPRQLVVTGFRSDGSPARGVQIAWFSKSGPTSGHVRLMMLDGTGSAVRREVGGATSGSLAPLQQEMLGYTIKDFQRAEATGVVKGSSSGMGGAQIHLATASGPGSAPGTGPLVLLDMPNMGPKCGEAWGDWQMWTDGAMCAVGLVTIESLVGAGAAIYGCGTWFRSMGKANDICDAENAANCKSVQGAFSTQYYNCNFDAGNQGCAATSSYSPGGIHVASGDYCPVQADAGAGGDDGGTSDEASTDDDGGAGEDDAATGDDGGADDDAGTDDDAGVDDDAGTDPGGDDGGDPQGDDGGADDSQDPPTDQELDDASKNDNCPSCQGQGTDLDVNPDNGDVTVAQQQDPGTSGNGDTPSTSDTTDPGGGGAAGGGGASGGSSGGGGIASGDDGTGQASEDQAAQDQAAQDQAAQDQAAQDQAAQDQAAQDQPAQDQPAQDATQDARVIHHRLRHPKKSGWRRLYEKVVSWWNG